MPQTLPFMIAEPSRTDEPLANRAARLENGPRPGHRVTIGATLALAAAGAMAWWAWASAEPGVPRSALRLAVSMQGTLVRDALVGGRTIAAASPTLVAPAAGHVTLAVRAGDAVARGQVLARLESPELAAERAREAATLAELQAALDQQRIRAQQQRAQAERDAAEAQLAQRAAVRDESRLREACSQGVVSPADCGRIEDSVQAAEIRSLHAGRAAALATQDADFGVQSLAQRLARRQAVLQELERRVQSLEVRSPVDGLVGTLAVAPAAAVAANAPLLTVVDLTRVEAELQVPEQLAEDLAPGLTVELRIGAFAARGTLVTVAPEVQRGQVLARVRFEGEQPAGLRQNQRLSARVLIDKRAGVLLLPRGPFVEAQSGHQVWVIDGADPRYAVRRPVALGALGVAQVEVRSGLQAGEQVVIAGTEHLGDARRVRLLD
jgi:HlyD family secretion protein